MNIKKYIKEEVGDFDWARDIKTNDTIAREIYDTLKWHKVPDVTTDFIQVPWVDIVFAVRKRTMSDSKIPLITPSTFYKGFTKYIREHYNIFDTDTDVKEIYNKVRELMGDKIHGTITESDDFDWTNNSKLIYPQDLVGYYFTYTEKKYTITKVDEMYLSDDPEDEKLTVYYKYRAFGEVRKNKMDVDTLIYRTKGGDYDLYDLKGNPVNPDDLVYSDGKLEDVDSVNENSDFDWVDDITPYVDKVTDLQMGEYYEIKDIDTKFFTTLIDCGWHSESELIRDLYDKGEIITVKINETMPNAILHDYVYCDGRTASWKPNNTVSKRGPVVGIEFYTEMDTSHHPRYDWIPFFDFYITDGMISFYNDNKDLNESTEFDWADSIKPNVLSALADVSKDNKRVNVIYSGENNYFTSIDDVRGFNYFTRVSFISYLRKLRRDWDTMPEALLNSMTVDELLGFIEKFLKDTFPDQEPFDIYEDYLYLYQFIKRKLK